MKISVEKIWDFAPHNAFTDLIRYKNCWYCVFRESDQHVSEGNIRVLQSVDGKSWSSTHLFTEPGVDLRDPKLSIAPNGKLMLLMEGVIYENSIYKTRQARVSFLNASDNWEAPKISFLPHEWPWGITWREGKGYTVSYRYSDPSNTRKKWLISLFVTEDGFEYKKLCDWNIPFFPGEARIRFRKNGKMVILLRTCSVDCKEWLDGNWIGTSEPPYTEWHWNCASYHLGGPNFLIVKNQMIAAGRIIWPTSYGIMEKTIIAKMTKKDLYPLLTLPSGGDCSYPGMVWHKDQLWVSYYSSHEGKAAIYLAKVTLPPSLFSLADIH